MKNRIFRILAAALVALLPACGGGGNGSGGTSGGDTGNPAFPVTMTEPSAGQTFPTPATIALSASVADPASVTMVEFFEATPSEPLPNDSGGGKVVATSTQPPFQATWADAPAGIHSFVARMTDTLGAQTFSDSVTISVLAPGESPGGWVPISRVPLHGRGRGISFVDAHQGWIAALDSIRYTGDGGASWVVQTTGFGGMQGPNILQMQFVDAGRGWAVGEDPFNGGFVLRTTDGGVTWIESNPGGTALSFIDAKVGWVVGGEEVITTKDGGVTWTPLPDPGMPLQAVRFIDRLNGWALGSADFRGVILHTADGGLTWTEQLRADLSVYFGAIDFVSASTGWVSRTGFLPEHNKILATSNGGKTWTEQSYPGSGTITALHFVSPSQGWGTGSFSGITHTEDGGQSWETQLRGDGLGFVDAHFIDAKRGWALAQNDLLFKTTTGGKAP